MAATMKRGAGRRGFDALVRVLLRLGIALGGAALLTVPGRKSARLLSVPVTPVQYDGHRYIVSPYGERAWTKNVRAAGKAVLSRGRHHDAVALTEVGANDAAPVLREYIQQNAITRKYFDVTPDSPTDEFVAEAPRHPVFRVG